MVWLISREETADAKGAMQKPVSWDLTLQLAHAPGECALHLSRSERKSLDHVLTRKYAIAVVVLRRGTS